MNLLNVLGSLCKGCALLEYRASLLELMEKEHPDNDNLIARGGKLMDHEVKQNLRSVYDRYATARNTSERPEWKNAERQYALRAFSDHGCTRLLEIGSGTCQDTLYFKENGLDVRAIDLSEEHVKCCREKGIAADAMDLYNMTFPSDLFDCIYSMNCFLHIPKNDLGSALEETRRVTKPGGLFYLGVYGGKDFEGYLRWTDYYDAERFFAFYEFPHYRRILEEFFGVMDAREVRLSDDLIFHAFLLRK